MQPDDSAVAQHLQGIADILQEAKKTGNMAEVTLDTGVGLTGVVRLGETESLEYHRGNDLTITVYRDGRKGTVVTTDVRPGAMQEALKMAQEITTFTEQDPCAGLADPERLAQKIPDCQLDHPWVFTPAEALAQAHRCEASARAQDARVTNSEGAVFSAHRGHRIYGNTHGFIGHYAATRYSLSCSVIAGSGDDMQREHDYTVARSPEALGAPEAVGAQAARRAVARLGARQIKTGPVAVVFAAEVAGSLWGHLLSAVSGSSLYRRASFLLDSVGKKILPDFVLLLENPHQLQGLGSAPFDSEGVETRSNALVESGVLKHYVLGSYAARKLGLTTTGNAGGVHNLRVSDQGMDQAALLKAMGSGLLVTELLGDGVNVVTGDYSRGVAGFWVENGVIQYPVHEITIASNLKPMLERLVAVGSDLDERHNIVTGSVWVDRMMVAGA